MLEFKCGDSEYRSFTYDQVYDYALDLRNFQKESHNKLLVPIMISTAAPKVKNNIVENERIIKPLRCSATNIAETIHKIVTEFCEPQFDYLKWENSEYLPTPTIVEAAQARPCSLPTLRRLRPYKRPGRSLRHVQPAVRRRWYFAGC